MPGLLRAVGRTAVVAGTASAVSGRVQRRQADKFAERDAHAAAAAIRGVCAGDRRSTCRTRRHRRSTVPLRSRSTPHRPQPQYAPPPEAPAAPSQADVISQLKQLGELRDAGVLTEEEFAAQKAKLLG